MGDFALDTAVEGADGRYRARLSRDWEIWGPNGGYLAAIALRAAGEATPFRRPASFTAHFLRVAEFGAVDVTVVPLRRAKRAASVRVSMTQGEHSILEAIVWAVADGEGLEHDVARIPEVPGPAGVPSIEDLTTEEERRSFHPFWKNFDRRPLNWVPWSERRPGPPVVRGWYRFRPRATFDDPFVDAARALLLIDTMLWPAALQPHSNDQPYIAPSLDIAAQFHDQATASDWLLCEATAPLASGGLIGGRATVWCADGRLVASGGGQMLCRPATPLRKP